MRFLLLTLITWNSFPEIRSATVASDAPGLHLLTVPALSNRPLYQSWGAEPSVPTLGTASELVRYDGLALLYAKPGPMPPLSPVFRRNTRLGLHHRPGSFVNSSDRSCPDSISRGFSRIYRVPRVRRVIRVRYTGRASCSHRGGRWFESSTVHHNPRSKGLGCFFPVGTPEEVPDEKSMLFTGKDICS